MALIPIDNVGQVGIVKETSPWQLHLMSGAMATM